MSDSVIDVRTPRTRAIAAAGGMAGSIASGALPLRLDITLSEAIVLGLLAQNVKNFLCVFGHGSTDLGESLRAYAEAGLVRVINVRHETEASHAAVALRWVTGEKAAVVTSIGPGALHALAGSLVSASDGLGVWYLMGDETTEDEGYNMQQVPRREQAGFLEICEALGEAYTLHTPAALPIALRRGLNTVDHPHRGGPFFLLMPMNTQPAIIKDFNLDELPRGAPPALGAARDGYEEAAEALLSSERIVIKAGGGARGAGPELAEFLGLVNGVAVLSPLVSGLLPFNHPRNMLAGGSKGSICGNFAMEEADTLAAIGSRFVCQSDCSRTGFLKTERVININTDMGDVTHYGKTIALLGDAALTLRKLNEVLKCLGAPRRKKESLWLQECSTKRQEWEEFKALRYNQPRLFDETWGAEVLTQPAAIKLATDFAREHDWVSFFDAGDVQANGFQIVEDERLGRTFTDTGASYMGFATSAVLATAIASKPFYALALTGDGSFMMNPQILIDGVKHGARGCVLILDNRRMAAISALQLAQYGHEFATADGVEVDYVKMAASVKGVNAIFGGQDLASLRAALEKAEAYAGLSVIHLPVYCGPDPLGGLGAFGRWNVGNWVEDTQALRHKLGL